MNESILVISDTHAPYNHPDTLDFLSDLRRHIKPDRIIHIGDEIDNHSISFHDSSPNLYSAGDELREAKKFVKQLEKLFPKMDLIESNHGSLVYRKAEHHGIPIGMIKNYNEILGVSKKWKWHFDLTVKLPNKQPCYFHHGKAKDILKVSQNMGMSAVQGHYHGSFESKYWGSPERLNFGMTVGCLIDPDGLAMAYGKNNLSRPVIGTGAIIDSLPHLFPMVLNKKGRWNGK